MPSAGTNNLFSTKQVIGVKPSPTLEYSQHASIKNNSHLKMINEKVYKYKKPQADNGISHCLLLDKIILCNYLSQLSERR